MLPLYWITGSFTVAAGLVVALPADYRAPAWTALAISYAVLCVWSCVSQTSTILGPCITRGADVDRVALTFDDGPGTTGTPELLDLLAERGVKASFFCVGKRVDQHPDVVRRIHAGGHLIGNHSHSHTPLLTFAHHAGLRDDLERCQRSLEEVTGERPRFFRPPFGLRTHSTAWAADRCGLQVVGWSAGGGDTGQRPVDRIVESIATRLTPGGIILLHDHGVPPDRIVEITRRVLSMLAERGLEPTRLDELLDSAPID